MRLNLIFYLLGFVALCSCNGDYGESFEKEELTAFDDPNVMRIDRDKSTLSFVPAANDPRFKLDKIPGSIFAEFDLTAYSPSWLDQDQYGVYFHMNMGWENGYNNGWYKNGVYGKDWQNKVYNSNLDS